jgi:hypothetical protein
MTVWALPSKDLQIITTRSPRCFDRHGGCGAALPADPIMIESEDDECNRLLAADGNRSSA